jgi:hypothetical protein
MRPLNKEEQTHLTNSLEHFVAILKRIGITELVLSENKPSIVWGKKKTDADILERLCSTIDKLYYGLPKEH